MSDLQVPIPQNSRYVPFTQQPSCCVPTCIQMVMYRHDIPLRPVEEIGHYLGLVVSPDHGKLFYGARIAAKRPTAGYGIQIHIPEYEPNAAFKRMGIPLSFSVEPIAHISSTSELLEKLQAHEEDDHDVLVAFNLGALLEDPSLEEAHHACVFDRIIDGQVRLVDPSFYAPKWRTFDPEQLFRAMQKHISSEWGGLWLLSGVHS
jgi:hypothetical protein